jgi:hypothetical protein
MRFKEAITAVLALSMASSPVLAQTAAPLSIASVSRAAPASGDASQLKGDSYLLPAIVIIAILTAAILLSNTHERPKSP